MASGIRSIRISVCRRLRSERNGYEAGVKVERGQEINVACSGENFEGLDVSTAEWEITSGGTAGRVRPWFKFLKYIR